jgi:hypothetical protein
MSLPERFGVAPAMAEEHKKIRKQHNINMDLFCIFHYPGSTFNHASWLLNFGCVRNYWFAEKQKISLNMMTTWLGRCNVVIIAYFPHFYKYLSDYATGGMKGK